VPETEDATKARERNKDVIHGESNRAAAPACGLTAGVARRLQHVVQRSRRFRFDISDCFPTSFSEMNK
jgi:hypothetical protein